MIKITSRPARQALTTLKDLTDLALSAGLDMTVSKNCPVIEPIGAGTDTSKRTLHHKALCLRTGRVALGSSNRLADSMYMSPYLPHGARLLSAYLSSQSADALLETVDDQPWRSDLKRRVQHYGWRYDYSARTVSPDMRLGPLPDWLAPLAQSIAREAEFDAIPDQVIINEYEPGQGISAHIDCAPCFGPAIASLSLTGGAEMVLQNTHTHDRISLRLEPRSLLILSGEARYDWTHAIPSRKSDLINGARIPRTRRVSLTFRTMELMDNKS